MLRNLVAILNKLGEIVCKKYKMPLKIYKIKQ